MNDCEYLSDGEFICLFVGQDRWISYPYNANIWTRVSAMATDYEAIRSIGVEELRLTNRMNVMRTIEVADEMKQ